MGKITVITSGKGGVGKTTATAALGCSLAMQGCSVALMDMDMGLRNLDAVLGLENRVVYDLRDVLEVRRSLEELAIDLACQRMTPEELEELKVTQEKFALAIKNGDAMQIAETDERYHEIIYDSTKNARLVQILNNLREQMYRYRLEYIKDEDKRQVLLIEHERILKAISLRHVQEAKQAIREHIDNQEITIRKNLKEQEEHDIQRKVSGRRN